MAFAPLLPTPFGDLAWLLSPGFRYLPNDEFCTNIQLKYLDCIEAYGLTLGRKKCADLFYDCQECHFKTFQKARSLAIYEERMKQYREGKLKKPFDEHPPLDSYMFLY